jgi:hypothetical protein
MTPRRTAGVVVFLAAALAAANAGQDEPKADGTKAAPKPGDRTTIPAAFRSYIVLDNRYPHRAKIDAKLEDLKPDQRDPKDRTGKMHDLVCENGLAPVVAVFVREDAKKFGPESGLAKLAKALDAEIRKPKNRADKLAAFVIFLKLEGEPTLRGKTFTGELTIPEDRPADETGKAKKGAEKRAAVSSVYGPDGKAVKVDDPVKGESTTELDYDYPDDEQRDAAAKDVWDFAKAVRDEAVKARPPGKDVPTFLVPFGVAPTKSKAVAAWDIKDDPITVVMYNRFHTLPELRWTFPADGPTDEQIKQVIDTTLKTIREQTFK